MEFPGKWKMVCWYKYGEFVSELQAWKAKIALETPARS